MDATDKCAGLLEWSALHTNLDGASVAGKSLSCATPYQEMGFSGGVLAQQMTANSFRNVARGNGYTGTTRVQDYLMLKAAETTLQNGGTHFAIITASDASDRSHKLNDLCCRDRSWGRRLTSGHI